MSGPGRNGAKRPEQVVVRNLEDGHSDVALPEEFQGTVRLECVGGIVAKVRVESSVRPLGIERDIVESGG